MLRVNPNETSTIDQVVFNYELAGRVKGDTHAREGAAFQGASGRTSQENASSRYELDNRYSSLADVGRRKSQGIAEWVTKGSPAELSASQHPPPGPSQDSPMSLAVPSIQGGANYRRERPTAPSNAGAYANRDEPVRGRKSLHDAGMNSHMSQLDDLVFSQASPRGPGAGSSAQLSPLRHHSAFEGAFGRTSQEVNQLYAAKNECASEEYRGKRRLSNGHLPLDAPMDSPRYEGMAPPQQPQQYAGFKSQISPRISFGSYD